MHLDLPTIAIVTVFIAALLGALLVFAGLQNHSVRAPLWWGAAHIVDAGGFALLIARGTLPDFISIDIANALVLFGYGLTWSGARVFDGRPVRLWLLPLAPLAWLLLCQIPVFVDDAAARIIAGSGLLAVLTLLTAEEFWRGRAEALMSRWPTIMVLLAHAGILVVRVPAVLLSPALRGDFTLSRLSFTFLAFGTLLYTVVLAFLELNMTKERTELKHKINSLVDPLSGVANRRAFLDGAATLLARHGGDHEPLAVLLFDLDHFKQINDQFGHATGDTVLQIFAGTATQTLGADILFARIGGEEFASCVPVGDIDEAYAIADRVRRNFAAAAARFGSERLAPSVSAGVTLRHDPASTVADLLAIVDRALYRAKELGRNRVEIEMPQAAAVELNAPSIVPIIGPDRGLAAHTQARRWRIAS